MMLAKLMAFVSLPCAVAKTALLLIDVQDCFLEANTTSGEPGSLSVPASHIIPRINQLRAEKSCLFDEVVFSQDFHPENHVSFGSTHGLAPFAHLAGKGGLALTCISPTSGNTEDAACCPTIYLDSSSQDCDSVLCPPASWDYDVNNSAFVDSNPACSTCRDTPDACYQTVQEMWTDHCLQSGDSTFPPSLDKRDGDYVVQKGMNQYVDAYSAFMDNTQSLKTELDAKLQELGVTTLYVAGIATDVCVRWTVRDALHSNTASYAVNVISDATAAVLGDVTNYDSAMAYMEQQGATLYTTAEVLAMACGTTTESATEADSSGATLQHGLLSVALFFALAMFRDVL